MTARGTARGGRGCHTEGLAYPLAGETLEAGSSRGVSNVFAPRPAQRTVERGVLLGVRPGDGHVTTCYKALVGLVLGRGARLLAGCGGSDEQSKQVVLVTHDAFAISPAVKKAFEDESGLELKILKAGDAGEVVTRRC